LRLEFDFWHKKVPQGMRIKSPQEAGIYDEQMADGTDGVAVVGFEEEIIDDYPEEDLAEWHKESKDTLQLA
jgi:hypothetical protein